LQSKTATGPSTGSLASELANEPEPARKRLVDSFAIWHERIEMGLAKMRERRDIAASADPHKLAFASLAQSRAGFF